MEAGLKIVECPRDAMQGIKAFIPTETKIAYHNALLKVGFDTLDFGSFVSPKAIPQMADTEQVLTGLKRGESATRLLAIVANVRGAQTACSFSEIDDLGYPFSVSPTFQRRNANATPEESLEYVQTIVNLCRDNNKRLVAYLSMAFGNPYGDEWSVETVLEYADQMAEIGVPILSLADTVGTATPEDITRLFETLIPRYPEITFGAHFHASAGARLEKIAAADRAGCRRFDGALKGFGGCPFAKDELVGNIATEELPAYFGDRFPAIDYEALTEAMGIAAEIFATFH